MKRLRILLLCGALLGVGGTEAWAAVTTTIQSAVAADGNGTAVTMYEPGNIAFQVTITGRASVNFEGSADGGTTYSAITCMKSGSTAGAVSVTTATGLFFCHAPGLSNARAPVVGWQTGTVTVVAKVQQNSLDTTLACEDQTNSLCMTSGGAVRGAVANIMSAVSTNTTGSAVQLPTGSKTIKGTLTCNAGGSTNCGITITIYGSELNTQATGTKVQLCQIIIPTGAAVTSDACPPITTAWLYTWAETTGVAGTSPSLNVTANY